MCVPFYPSSLIHFERKQSREKCKNETEATNAGTSTVHLILLHALKTMQWEFERLEMQCVSLFGDHSHHLRNVLCNHDKVADRLSFFFQRHIRQRIRDEGMKEVVNDDRQRDNYEHDGDCLYERETMIASSQCLFSNTQICYSIHDFNRKEI